MRSGDFQRACELATCSVVEMPCLRINELHSCDLKVTQIRNLVKYCTWKYESTLLSRAGQGDVGKISP